MDLFRKKYCHIIANKLQYLYGEVCSFFFRNKTAAQLHTLTPNPDLKSNSYYVDHLKGFIRTKGVRNIALSGDYGVGKSSIIALFTKSFFSKTRKTRVVSLLTLSEKYNVKPSNSSAIQTSSKNNDGSKNSIRKNVQREIFRQLYYGEKPGLLRLSRYSRIGKFPVLVYGVLIIVSVFLLNVAIERLGIDITINQPYMFLILFCGCIFVAFLIHLLALRIETFIQNISVMGVGAVGFSLNLAKENPDFEKATDELIYYFKKTGCRILVLEDLDRFCDPCIYEGLRQLNTVINGAKHIHRKVVFIYALRDSLINDPKARTKLFDAIVPVVPFITQDNALQKVNEVFRLSGFSKSDIADVCKVLARNIKDMRTIKAICNTAVVMRDTIGDINTGLRIAEIVAMATIREIYPSQYDALRRGESQLDELYEECTNSKKLKITNFNKKIKDREHLPDALLSSSQEAFWEILSQPLESDSSYIFNSAQRNSNPFTKDLIDKNFWLELINNHSVSVDITYKHNCYSYTKQQVKIISIESMRQKSEDFHQLEDLLAHDSKYYESSLKTLLEQDVFQEAETVDYYKNAMTDVNIIKELLLAGAIDESYKLYLSPMSDISGSIELRTFRVKCLNSHTADYAFGLSDDDVKELLDEADSTNLQSSAFYNHSIIRWLIEHNDKRLDVILRSGQRNLNQLLDFFNFECHLYEKELSQKYGGVIDVNPPKEKGLLNHVKEDFILHLTKELAERFPSEMLMALSSTTSLRDTIGKEIIFVVAVLSILEPATVIFSEKDKKFIKPLLDYYEDTITLNGGTLKLGELRVANNLPTKNLELYSSDSDAINILVSNVMFEINTITLKEAPVNSIIQKLEKDGLTSGILRNIVEEKGNDSKLIRYCLERPDLEESLTDLSVNAKLVKLAYRHRIKLQKEQIMNLIGTLTDGQIIDLMLVSDLLWPDYEEIFKILHRPYCNIQLGKRPLLPAASRSQHLANKLKEFGVISREPVKKSKSLQFSMKRQKDIGS